MKIRVYYEDTDAGGIVYHSRFINFCERARSELFFQKGLVPVEEGGGFVVKEFLARYLAPAKLGDTLEVMVELKELKNASLKLYQEIRKDDARIFEAELTLVFVKKDKPAKIPEKLKNVFTSLL